MRNDVLPAATVDSGPLTDPVTGNQWSVISDQCEMNNEYLEIRLRYKGKIGLLSI
ncbi:hypothetical protein [Echinicola rosea]|uniref:hypothetical protein n=1 Tax=Echinicola rosea TaxID=1807691 RepID=UPI00188A3565|nr:hypothetical protein [Echinicola rosea]